jgi:hypothetical protein
MNKWIAGEIIMKFGINPAHKRIILYALVVITAAGSVFFFPLIIAEKYTCYYHQIFDHTHPVVEGNINEPLAGKNKNKTGSDNHYSRHKTHAQGNNISQHHSSLMLQNYLRQYAFAWWASVGVLALCIYLLVNLKKQARGINRKSS